MKRLVTFLISLAVVLASLPCTAFAQEELTGSGQAADPYVIKNAEDLVLAAEKINSGDAEYVGMKYVLTQDISMEDINFPMIDRFSGVLDGLGHTISNLTINDTETGNVTNYGVGFVRYNTGTIKNIRFQSPRISTQANSAGNGYSGAAVVAAENNTGGVISACMVEDAVVDAPYMSKAAGITALNGRDPGVTASVSNCFVSGKFIGGPRTSGNGTGLIMGGIAGYSATSTIENCIAMVELSSASSASSPFNAGIICGYSNDVAMNGNVAYSGKITYDTGYNAIYAGAVCPRVIKEGIAHHDNLAGEVSILPDSGDIICHKPGVSATAEQLAQQSTYEELGWDFTNVWKMDEEAGYPVLRFGKSDSEEEREELLGSGTKQDPYQISNEQQLLSAVAALNSGDISYEGKAFALTQDIEMTSEFPMIKTFSGVIDGNGHIIKNLVINDQNTASVNNYCIGFVRYNTGTIKNIIFDTPRVTSQAHSNNDGFSGAAVVAGENAHGGLVYGCRVINALVDAPYLSKAAGITCLNGRESGVNAAVKSCYVSGVLKCGPRPGYGPMIGGIASYSATSTIEHCIADTELEVYGSSDMVSAGIICGYPNAVTFTRNVAYGGSISYDASVCSKPYIGRIYGLDTYTNHALTANLANEGITVNGTTFSNGGKNGENRTAEQLRKQETYEDAGWDFEIEWEMDTDAGYPIPKFFGYEKNTVSRVTVAFNGDSKSEMGFNWYYSNGQDSEPVLQISETEDFNGDYLEFPGQSTEVNGEFSNKAEASGLRPAAKYYYRVGSKQDGVFSDTGSFETAPESGSFSFINVSDSEAADRSEAKLAASVLSAAQMVLPDSKFVLHGGDFTDSSRGEDGWQDYLYLSSKTLQNTVIAPTIGENDQMDDAFSNHFNVTGDHYSFDYSCAHFSVLNTCEGEDCISDQQIDWLRQDVAAARRRGAQWILLSMHKGVYTSGAHADDADITALRAKLIPVIDELNIDLVFQGHDHIMGRTSTLKGGKVTGKPTYMELVDGKRFDYSVNPDGTIYLMSGAGGAQVYNQIGSMTGAQFEDYINMFERSDQRSNGRGKVQTFAAVTVEPQRISVGAYEIKLSMQPTMIDGFGIDKQVSTVNELIDSGNIKDARAAYNQLTQAQRGHISNYDKLIAMESPGISENGGLWTDPSAETRQSIAVRNDTKESFYGEAVRVKLEHIPNENMKFYSSQGEVLPYEIEYLDPDGVSIVWVRVPVIAANSTTFLWVYFGGQANDIMPELTWQDKYELVEHFADNSDNGDIRSDSTGKQAGKVTGTLTSKLLQNQTGVHFANTKIEYGSIGDDYDAISVSAVVSMTAADLAAMNGRGGIVAKYADGDPRGRNTYLLGIEPSANQLNSYYGFVWWRENTMQRKNYSNSMPAADGEPHLLTLTYDGFTVVTYLDGKAVSEETVFIEGSSFVDPKTPTTIGAYSDSTGIVSPYAGTIYDVQITGARTSHEWESFRYENYFGDAVSVGEREHQGDLSLLADISGKKNTMETGLIKLEGILSEPAVLSAEADGEQIELGAAEAGVFSKQVPVNNPGEQVLTVTAVRGEKESTCQIPLSMKDTQAPSQPQLRETEEEGGVKLGASMAAADNEKIGVEFYRAKAVPLSEENVRMVQSSTASAVPLDIDPRNSGLQTAVPEQQTTAVSNGENPYQIYEITLTPQQQVIGSYRISWTGQSERQVHLYAYNNSTGKWDKKGSSTGDGEISINAPVSGKEYFDEGKLYIMVFRGLGTTPEEMTEFIPDRGQYDFTMFWNSDTQYMSQFYEAMNKEQYQWIADSFADKKGVITFNTGDIANRTNLNYEYNWRVVNDTYKILEENNIPYTFSWGNHDYFYDGKPNEDRYYKTYFPISRLRNNTGNWKLEDYYNGTNNMCLTNEIDGAKIMILALGYRMNADDIEWAANLAETHGDYNVIILTHDFSSGGSIRGRNSALLKSKVIDPNPNVKLVLCGHIDGTDLIAPIEGRDFYSVLQDYQGESGIILYGGCEFLRQIQFDVENNLVYFNTYSPLTGETLSPYGKGTYKKVNGLYQKNRDEFAVSIDFGGGQDREVTTQTLTLYASEGEKIGEAEAKGNREAEILTSAPIGSHVWYTVMTDPSGNQTTSLPRIFAAEGTLDPTAPVELIARAGEEKAMLAWEAPSDAEKIEVQISSDGGNTWTTLSDTSEDGIHLSKAVTADSTGVEVLGLTADREYSFKLLVTGGTKDGESTIARVTPTAVPVLPDSISTAETEWRYLDNNTDPGTEQDRYAWTRPDFDDSAWKTAKGSFGAKNGGKSGISGGFTVNTLLNQYINGVSGDDIPTYFFRTKINIKDASKIESLTGSIVYDDAAIVYINGVKAAAFDEPDGGYASNMSYGGSNADAPKRAEINITDTSMLKDGVNTIAVELHNGRSNSSDIYLDFVSLTANAALELNAAAGERDVKLEWTPLPKDAFVGLQISADGANWYSLSEEPVDSNDAANGAYLTKEITAADTSADVCGLKGGTKYQFRLVVAVGDNPADILTAEATPTAEEPDEPDEPDVPKISIGDITYSGGIITVKYTADDTVKDGEILGFLAFAADEEDTEDTVYTDQNVAYQTIFSHSSGVESISFPMPYVTANGVAGIDTTKALIVKIGGETIPTAAKKFVIPDEPSEPGDEFTVKAESDDGKVTLTWPENTDAESISIQISDNGANWKTLSNAENEDGIYLSRNVSASDTAVDILGLTNGKTYMFKLVITGGSKAGEYLASASPAGEENPDKPSQPISFTASAGEKKAVLNWPDTAQEAKAVGVEISLNGQNWSALSGSALTAGGALNGAYLNGAISTSATTVEVRGLTAGVTYFFKLTVVGGASAGEYTASAVPTDSGNTGGGSGSGSGSKGNTWSSLPSGGGALLPTQPSQPTTPEENNKPDTDEPSVNDLPSFMPDNAKQEIFEQTPWAIPYISTLVKIGAIDGTADSIRPSEEITRAEFVKIIVSALGLELDYKADSGFSDAARGEWYTPYIAAGVKSGIINGMGDGTFGVDTYISRQDIAAIIYRAAQKMLEKGSLEMFSDASAVSDYAADGVSALTKAGIINGMGDGTFAPLNHATRAEAAKMLAGIYSYMEAQTEQELEQ